MSSFPSNKNHNYINSLMVDASFRLMKKDSDGNRYFSQTIEDNDARTKYAIGVDYIMSEMFDNVECYTDGSDIIIKIYK